MYILFDIGQENATSYSDTVKPFTTGIKVNDISDLKKEIEEISYVNKTQNGKQLYIDKFGMPTVDSRDAEPYKEKIVTKEIIDFSHYPHKFTRIDVMKYKQSLLLEEYKADECFMYEFNLNNFVDMKLSQNIQVLQDDVELFKNGYLKTKAINIKGYKNFSILVDSKDKVDCYYSYNGENFAKAKKNNVIVDEADTIMLGFKNKVDNDNMVYGYQLLLKK